jgi:dihydroxy-acid dehydratase
MGCDKTTPALLMGAASCNLPTIGLSGGPMLSGHFRGKQIGSGTGVWQMSEDVRAGKMSQEEFTAAESCMHRSKGHCMTMGTASTMASMVEALGVALPGNAAIPAVDARRYRQAQLTGRRIVEMVEEDLVLSKILTRPAFENAIRVNAAIGGSTNAVIHLLAIAGRIGVPLKLEDWDKLGSQLPCLVNLQPSGQFLMEDFYYAGGLPAVMREIAHLLDGKALTVNGHTIAENIAAAPNYNRDVIKPLARRSRSRRVSPCCAAISRPMARSSSRRPRRRTAASIAAAPWCSRASRISTRASTTRSRHRRELHHGAQGLRPEGLSRHGRGRQHAAAAQTTAAGITDILRISDARMSGTAYGAVVLHVSPEAAAGGPLALVQNGDLIEVDVPARRLHLDVSDAELAQRRAAGSPAPCRTRLVQAVRRSRAAGASRRRSGRAGGVRAVGAGRVSRDSH